MGIVGNFRMASDDDIRRLLKDPESIEGFLYPESDEQEQEPAEIDVDKAWHGIHFLLCGDAWEGDPPLNFVAYGGLPVGDVDVGYGPARVFKASEVAGIAQALTPVTAAGLRTKFDAKAFSDNEIYPNIWDEPIEDCLDTYVLTYFEELKAFILKARDEKQGLVVFLN